MGKGFTGSLYCCIASGRIGITFERGAAAGSAGSKGCTILEED